MTPSPGGGGRPPATRSLGGRDFRLLLAGGVRREGGRGETGVLGEAEGGGVMRGEEAEGVGEEEAWGKRGRSEQEELLERLGE